VKSVERLAKHAINIAENCLTLNQLSIDRGIYGGLERLSDSSLKLFNDSMEAFFERDPQKATEVVNNVSSIHNMKGDLILTIAKQASQDLPQLRLILESIIRTAEYAVDIAEALLNITAFRVIVEE
jgi:phosphate uptake regulator